MGPGSAAAMDRPLRSARTFMAAVIRSDEPEMVADLLGLPRSEPGIEHL